LEEVFEAVAVAALVAEFEVVRTQAIVVDDIEDTGLISAEAVNDALVTKLWEMYDTIRIMELAEDERKRLRAFVQLAYTEVRWNRGIYGYRSSDGLTVWSPNNLSLEQFEELCATARLLQQDYDDMVLKAREFVEGIVIASQHGTAHDGYTEALGSLEGALHDELALHNEQLVVDAFAQVRREVEYIIENPDLDPMSEDVDDDGNPVFYWNELYEESNFHLDLFPFE
jgi:hypothetical protein